MNNEIFFMKDRDNNVSLVSTDDTGYFAIPIGKISTQYEDGFKSLSYHDKIYYYNEKDIIKVEHISTMSKIQIGLDKDIYSKMDKKIIMKKKTYFILYYDDEEESGDSVVYITDDLYILSNFNQSQIETLKQHIKKNIGFFKDFTIIDQQKNTDYKKITYAIITMNEFKNIPTEQLGGDEQDDIKSIDIITDEELYIFRESPARGVKFGSIDEQNWSDAAQFNYFSIYKKIIYIFTDTEFPDMDRIQHNYYLLYRCLLNKEEYDKLNDLGAILNVKPLNEHDIKEIFLYAMAEGAPYKTITVKDNYKELNEYQIIKSICEIEPCLTFKKLCNTLCTSNLDQYFLDILKNAKKLYETGMCYQTYNDIHGALFNLSNCATLFYSIENILIKKYKSLDVHEQLPPRPLKVSGGPTPLTPSQPKVSSSLPPPPTPTVIANQSSLQKGVFSKRLTSFIQDKHSFIKSNLISDDTELQKFYQDFEKKNKELLISLKTLQEQFKLMNRTQKPEEDEVNTCVNIKNVVFHDKKECKFFEDIIGLDKPKEKIISTFIMPIIYPSLFGKLSKGILLYGPPGTGKTAIVKAAVNSLQRDYVDFNLSVLFFSPTPADLKGKYVGESEKKIKELFNCASEKACECQDNDSSKTMRYISVIFIDEIDNVGGSRSGDESGMNKQTVNALLQAMDGMESHKNVIVMGATNNPWELDSALLRRFNNRLLIDLPDDINIRTLLEKEFIDYIVNTNDYSNMCKKKNVSNENNNCLNVCGDKKKEVNIYEELQKLNRTYNILPYQYENIIQKLSADIRKKLLSNSDINQTLRGSFSKMGSRTLENELFINVKYTNNEYIASQSIKEVMTNTSEWGRSALQTNYLKYFFNNIQPNHYHLLSFNNANYDKFKKPYININDEVYLNINYCVDRHPFLYLNFENIKAAYIKKESYENMIKSKKGETFDLSQCKILIEKDVEIVSEMKPLLDNVKSKIDYKSYGKSVFDFFLQHPNLSFFITPSIANLLYMNTTEIFNFFSYNFKDAATILVKIGSYISPFADDNTPFYVLLGSFAPAIGLFKYICVLLNDNSDLNKCYDLYINQYKPILILSYILNDYVTNQPQNIDYLHYEEDSEKDQITITDENNSNGLPFKVNDVCKDFFENKIQQITNWDAIIPKIRSLQIIKPKYSKIFFGENTDFSEEIKELEELKNGTGSIPDNIKMNIKENLINYLHENKSLSITKTLYFECEIDLQNSIYRVWGDTINNALNKVNFEFIKKPLWLALKGIGSVIKKIFNSIFKMSSNNFNQTIETDDDIINDLYKGINDIYQNITYLLLSNCKAYYVIHDNKLSKILINNINITKNTIKEYITKNITALPQIIASIIFYFREYINIALKNYNYFFIYISIFILGDYFFDKFNIPPVRTLQISNLLKQEKIFVSFKTFKELNKGNYEKLFSQTTSYIPLLNYIDTFTGLNRILYKITNNTSLLCFSNTFSIAATIGFMKSNEFVIKENNGILEMHYSSANEKEFKGKVNEPAFRAVQRYFAHLIQGPKAVNKMSGGNPTQILPSIYDKFIEKIGEKYRYEDHHYIDNQTAQKYDEIPYEILKEIWESIPRLPPPNIANDNLEYIFYQHIISPKLKNYTIHFDIIKKDFQNKNSMININDYNDLKKYEIEPDKVIQDRVEKKKKKESSGWSLFK